MYNTYEQEPAEGEQPGLEETTTLKQILEYANKDLLEEALNALLRRFKLGELANEALIAYHSCHIHSYDNRMKRCVQHQMHGSWSDINKHNVAIRCDRKIRAHLKKMSDDEYFKKHYPDIVNCRQEITSLLHTKKKTTAEIQRITKELETVKCKIRVEHELNVHPDNTQHTTNDEYYKGRSPEFAQLYEKHKKLKNTKQDTTIHIQDVMKNLKSLEDEINVPFGIDIHADHTECSQYHVCKPGYCLQERKVKKKGSPKDSTLKQILCQLLDLIEVLCDRGRHYGI